MAKVTFLISKLCSNLNIGRNMNAQQVASCAEAIVEDMWRLKLDDIDLCFRNGLKGNYGQIYDRMDQMTIFGWLKEYEKERDNAIAKKRDTEQINNIYETFQHPQMKQILEDVTSKLTMKETPKVTEFKPRELTPQEQLFQDLLVEFDEIWAAANQPREATWKGEKVIWLNDQWMDRNDFVEFKTNKQDNEA